MARRTGAKHKLCRRAGVPLCGSPKCPALRRPYPPGQHGQGRRRKESEFGIQLLEKQKLKFIYGVQEKQFRRYYEEAVRRQGITGETLLSLLEKRLDNIVYRLGYARSIDGARQLVTHGHVTVDGKRVDIPSYSVRPGQQIGLSTKAVNLKHVAESLEQRPVLPPYLSYEEDDKRGVLLRDPAAGEVPVHIDTSLIVEYYSR